MHERFHRRWRLAAGKLGDAWRGLGEHSYAALLLKRVHEHEASLALPAR